MSNVQFPISKISLELKVAKTKQSQDFRRMPLVNCLCLLLTLSTMIHFY